MNLIQRLIEGRQKKSWTEEDVANEMRISTDLVKKLESDQHSPEKLSVYEKGYLRVYAKLVGVDVADVDEYLAHLGVLQKPHSPGPQKFYYGKKRKKSYKFLYGLVLVLLILVVVWVEWQRDGDVAVSPAAVTQVVS